VWYSPSPSTAVSQQEALLLDLLSVAWANLWERKGILPLICKKVKLLCHMQQMSGSLHNAIAQRFSNGSLRASTDQLFVCKI
jgi:hypothetical protein